jgi:tetratricopeptide (TPR) repeat protein
MKNILRLISISIFCAVLVITANAQITRVSQIPDVKETDKHYNALKNLIENYGAFEPFPDATFRANQPLTRGEFAKQLERGITKMRRNVEQRGVKVGKFDLNNPYSGNIAIIQSAKDLKDLPPTNEYYIPIKTLLEDYGIDLSDAGYFRPNKAITEKEFYTWIPVIFKIDFNGNPSPTEIVLRGEWIIGMSNAFNTLNFKVLELVSKKQNKSEQVLANQNEKKVEPTPTPKPSVSKSKDVEALIEAAENYEKAGNYSNALINYKEAGDAAWDAPTEMKCGIAVYRIAKFLIERDRNGEAVFEFRKDGYRKDLEDAINFLDSAILSDKSLVEAYKTRAAAFRLLKEVGVDKTKQAEADERKVRELSGSNSTVPTKSKLEIINSLPSLGKARITGKGSFYLPDNPCSDLSKASSDLKIAVEKGGIWGNYKMNKGDTGDIIFETNNSCEKGKLILLRVGTAIVTIGEKDVKRIK